MKTLLSLLDGPSSKLLAYASGFGVSCLWPGWPYTNLFVWRLYVCSLFWTLVSVLFGLLSTLVFMFVMSHVPFAALLCPRANLHLLFPSN